MSEFWRRTAVELAELISTRQVSATDVAKDALARLEAANPRINAIVEYRPDDVLEQAAAVDAALGRGDDPGPLAGVPVTIKVNTDQAGYTTTNGLRLQRDLVATTDSPLVSNFRKAGAILLGRTNTPAFSLRWFTRNSLHGHTRNPWDYAITPGGSSGGAAAGLAAGIGAIAHGTDIGGSIRYPAYACGVHGLRPTLGRIPAWNPTGADRHVGGQLMAVSGPLARTIADVRLAFGVMSARDIRDPWWTDAPAVGPKVPRRVAMCVCPDGMKVQDEVAAAVADAGKRLQAAGWAVEEVESPPLREPAQMQAILWLAEFRRAGRAALDREADPDALFVFSQMEELCPAPTLESFMDALQRRSTFLREWMTFFDRYPVVLMPVSGELPFADQDDVRSPERFRQIMAAQLPQLGLPLMGLPGLTVSTGLCGRSPVGVQLVAARYREDLLFEAGLDIEAQGAPTTPIDPA
jgi:amidase